ncbi:MAG: hypothetical protein JO362_16605 [Streptomycetaceae bacterium]|nr:hypothetical protein [Streptomycetaceae bacterium]
MTRPPSHEWAVLGEDSDPIPGDPDAMAQLGRDLRKTAEAIEREAGEIRALASVEEWKSDAATAFRASAEKAEDKLRKAFHRYHAAAEALGTDVRETGGPYASELARAQQMADKALRDAQEADAEHRSATNALAHQPPNTPPDDPINTRLKSHQEAASASLAQARSALQAAKDVRDAAAKAAAAAINHAITHDGLHDTGWDKFKNWVHDNAGWINQVANIAGWVATICGALSLAVGWIPIIGQAVAGVLDTIALIAGVVSLACHLVLALAGEGSWFDVVLDVVGLATYGMGRSAIASARGAADSTQALARTAVYRQALQEATERGLKPGTKAFNKAVQQAWKAANRTVEGAPRGKAAAQAVSNAPGRWLPGWKGLADAFNPVSIAKESWEGIKDLKVFHNIGDLSKSDTWRDVHPTAGDPAMENAKSDVQMAVNATHGMNEEVNAAAYVFHTHMKVWVGNSAAAWSTDITDKFGVWDDLGVKDATTFGNDW